MLSQKCHLNPTSRNTPTGGNKMAKMILMGSVAVNGIGVEGWLFRAGSEGPGSKACKVGAHFGQETWIVGWGTRIRT